MGWLLLRKKTKSQTRSRSPREKWDRQRTIQGIKWLASVAVLIGLVAGWKVGQVELIAYAGSRGQPVAAAQVELVACPPWIRAEVQRDLQWLASGHLTADPLDRTGLDRAYLALSGNAWIESVQRIERTATGVRVFATYRAPAAIVMLPRQRDHADDFMRAGDRFYVIDAKGYRLPTDSQGLRDEPYTQAQLKQIGLPVIVGVTAAAPKAGQLWTGDDVQAGIALAKLLHDEPYSKQIVAYDVAGRDTRKRVRMALRTRANGVVWWGLPPGQEKSIERDAKVKMQWMAQISTSKEHRFSIDSGGKTVALYTEVPTILSVDEDAGSRLTGASTLAPATIHRARVDIR